MTDDNGPTDALSRAFAPMLAQLENEETRLVNEQAALAKQLGAIDADLARIAAAKAAMLGRPAKKPRAPSSPGRATYTAPETRKRQNAALAWAKQHGEPFTGKELADGMGLKPQGVGPILRGMVRAGMFNVTEDGNDGKSIYSVA